MCIQTTHKFYSTIFKQDTIKSWFTGIDSSINSEIVVPFSNAEQIIYKYNQAIEHNSLTQQGWQRLISQCDDELANYLTNIKGTTASMTTYSMSLQGSITGYKKITQALEQYNALGSVSQEEQQNFVSAIALTNPKLNSYLSGLNGANATFKGYTGSLVGATLKTIGLQFATMALNAAVTMGASIIISGIVTAISNWIRQDEILAEKAEEARQKIDELNNDYKEHGKLVSDSAKRYAELAQGVDRVSGKNISLNNDDYEEFLDLSNQLAEAFPTLSRNYDENGNAILKLSGNVDTIVGSLNNLIETERELKNQEIADNLPTVFKDVKKKSDNYTSELEDLYNKKDTLSQGLGSEKFNELFENKYIDLSSKDSNTRYKLANDYVGILKKAGVKHNVNYYLSHWDSKGNFTNDPEYMATITVDPNIEIGEDTKAQIESGFANLAKEYESELSEVNDKIQSVQDKNKTNWSSLNGSLAAWLNTEDSYKILSDDMQFTVQNIINSLDWESLDFASWEEAKKHIQDNIFNLFQNSDGKEALKKTEIMFDIQTRFNNGEISFKEYKDNLDEFLSTIKDLPDETKKSLKLLFGITTDNGSDIDEMFTKVKGNFDSSSISDLDENIKQLNINDLQFLSNLNIPLKDVNDWNQVEEILATIGPSSKKANDGLKSLSEVLKEVENSYALLNEVQKDFNSTGVISSDNIQKILSKFPDLEDELYEYIMGMRSGASVMDLIKSKSDNMASMSSEAFRKMFLSSNSVSDGMKKQFAASFDAVGIGWENTMSVMANVNSQIIDANGKVTNSFSEQWNNACQAAGTSVSLFAQALGALFSGGTEGFIKKGGNLWYTSPDGRGTNIVNTTVHGIIEDIKDKGNSSTYYDTYKDYFSKKNGEWDVNDKDSLYSTVNAKFWGQLNANKKNKDEFDAKQKELEEKLKSLGISNSPNGSSSNTLNYESPIDAVINRIKHDSNLVNKAIEETNKQLELIDMESDPEKYRKLVESKIQDQKKLDSLYIAAQKELHKEADVLRNNGRYNIDSWFDEFGNATEKYYLNYNSAKTSDEQSNIKKLFDAVKKYKDSWSELQDKRQSAAKELLDSEKELVQCLERELEITKTLASAHNNSYSNQKTNIERDISNIEHLIEVSSSSAEKANLNSRLSDVYKRGIETAKQNMANVHSDADYWRGLLGSVLSDNGFSFDITKWFSESGDILEQFNADMNTITDETAKAEIRSYVDIISSKKSAYVEFYEWQQSMEKNLNASRKSALDELKDAVDELFDLRLKKIDSEKSLLEKHYSLTNSLAQEQHNLNKELLEAETTGARMNEHERSLLFSKSEHAKLSSKLNQILGEANVLQAQYTYDLQHATKNTIEEITNNYERQYDLKMKEYEIVRAELELAQAEQKLENVKNEKSVRTWNGSKWVYEAVLQDVIDAQNEVEDRKYDLAQAKIQDAQQKSLNKLSATSEALTTEQNIFADSLARLSGEVTDAGIKLSNALQNIAKTDLQLFRDILGSVGQTLSSTLNIKTDDIAKKVSQRERSGGSPAFILNTKTGTWTDVEKGTTTKASAESISKANRSASSGSSSLGLAGLMQKFSSAKEALSSLGTYGPTKSGSSSTAKKRKAPRLKLTSKKYADGARNAENGLAYFDEEGDGSEVIITKYGKLRQFSSGETVFSKEATDRLYDMATSRSYNPFSSVSPSLPDPSQYVQNNKTSQDNRSYSINGITIQDDKGKELLKEVANYIWKKN